MWVSSASRHIWEVRHPQRQVCLGYSLGSVAKSKKSKAKSPPSLKTSVRRAHKTDGKTRVSLSGHQAFKGRDRRRAKVGFCFNSKETNVLKVEEEEEKTFTIGSEKTKKEKSV